MDFTNLKTFMDHMTREKCPGNAVQVYLRGQQVFSYASGYADLENQTPMNGTELLNIYSCSKVTTVTAGLQLLEQGKFLLTDPLYEYIPEYRHMALKLPDGTLGEAKNPIRIKDLFCMTTGLSYDRSMLCSKELGALTGGKYDTETAVRYLANMPLDFEPGTKWQYSLSHDVLAGLIAIIAGKPFRQYVKENIFDPLDMKESFYHRTPEIEARMAKQYMFMPADGREPDLIEAQKCGSTRDGWFRRDAGTEGTIGTFVPGPAYDSGGAGIVTSVPDYVKLVAALSMGGTGLTGERILSPAAVELLHTDALTAQNRANYDWHAGYSYGLGVRTLMDKAAAGALSPVGEFGWGGAAGATVIADTKNQLAVFYAHHMLNPQEEYYQPRLRNTVYSCL